MKQLERMERSGFIIRLRDEINQRKICIFLTQVNATSTHANGAGGNDHAGSTRRPDPG
jgi:hypothetical protein